MCPVAETNTVKSTEIKMFITERGAERCNTDRPVAGHTDRRNTRQTVVDIHQYTSNYSRTETGTTRLHAASSPPYQRLKHQQKHSHQTVSCLSCKPLFTASSVCLPASNIRLPSHLDIRVKSLFTNIFSG